MTQNTKDQEHRMSDSTTPQGGKAMSPASTGSVADGESDRPKPIKSARLAALEELSALDQALELQYGLTGNPMIKGQERTPQMQPTPSDGSVRTKGTCK